VNVDMLQIVNVTRTYANLRGTVEALAGVSLQVAAGEFVAVRGPSGCGKTTLLLTAGGLLRPDSGRVTVAGQDFYAMGDEARAGFRAVHVGFVFQQFHLMPYLSVLDNVLAAALALPLQHARERAMELLRHFGLESRAHHVPAELSSGERQRTALARALLHNPRLLLADEPTGNLDPDNGRVVLQCLADQARAGAAVLLVTHDPQAAAGADRIVAFDRAGTLGGAA
jgi:ABC-type lipoprotein export system ATPase subunit